MGAILYEGRVCENVMNELAKTNISLVLVLLLSQPFIILKQRSKQLLITTTNTQQQTQRSHNECIYNPAPKGFHRIKLTDKNFANY
jgi:hypothetical protein